MTQARRSPGQRTSQHSAKMAFHRGRRDVLVRPGLSPDRMTLKDGLERARRSCPRSPVLQVTSTHKPHDLAQSVRYQVVRDHFETFRAQAASLRDGDGLRRFVETRRPVAPLVKRYRWLTASKNGLKAGHRMVSFFSTSSQGNLPRKCERSLGAAVL
jgi:hypothetical protein